MGVSIAARRLPSLLATNPVPPDSDDRSRDRPARRTQPTGEPPPWFQRYWVLLSTVAGFILGAYFLQQDLSDGSVDAVPAIIYMTMMGYLPIAALGGLLKR